MVAFKKSTNTWTSAFKSSFLPSSLAREKSKRRQSIEQASISLKGSHSQENLYSDLKLKSTLSGEFDGSLTRTDSGDIRQPPPPPILEKPAPPPPSPLKNKLTLNFKPRLTPTLGQIMSGCGPPEITVVTPRFGPASGGTRVTIRGANLGKSREDILSLSVNGSDVRVNLEWHSSAKVTFTTKPWGGSGPVAMVTKSGGRGTSNVKFTFEEKKGKSVYIFDISEIFTSMLFSYFIFKR